MRSIDGERFRFSALQRAEIAEIGQNDGGRRPMAGFSALQRAEIAEIASQPLFFDRESKVSVLFNEPKLLKSIFAASTKEMRRSFSALQRAEIAEIRVSTSTSIFFQAAFQCSSTSRNC